MTPILHDGSFLHTCISIHIDGLALAVGSTCHLLVFLLRLQMDMAVASLIDTSMSMKRLLLLIDMARQGLPEGTPIPIAKWSQVIRDVSGATNEFV